MARPKGLRKLHENKSLSRLTAESVATDFQGISLASANAPTRADSSLEKETAVPAGPRNGGKTFAKASNFHGSEYVGYGLGAIPNMPSRAALARKWPKLRINRLTWRWRDDASGAYGSDVASLLAFLGEGAR